ncbi:MAG: MFS transporter [Bacteroidales bacterium]
MNTNPDPPSAASFPIRSTLLLVGVFFITFIGRSVLSPLLLPIERELGISHAEGGSFFLIISVGLMLTMLFSGMVSQRLKHHSTIALSAVLTGAALILIAVAGSLFWFRVGLFFLGAGAGLYLPSGITTLTDVVPSEQWGRAIALHELGPIFGLAIAPILADIALPFFNWQVLLLLLGIVSLLTGAIFARYFQLLSPFTVCLVKQVIIGIPLFVNPYHLVIQHVAEGFDVVFVFG